MSAIIYNTLEVNSRENNIEGIYTFLKDSGINYNNNKIELISQSNLFETQIPIKSSCLNDWGTKMDAMNLKGDIDKDGILTITFETKNTIPFNFYLFISNKYKNLHFVYDFFDPEAQEEYPDDVEGGEDMDIYI